MVKTLKYKQFRSTLKKKKIIFFTSVLKNRFISFLFILYNFVLTNVFFFTAEYNKLYLIP